MAEIENCRECGRKPWVCDGGMGVRFVCRECGRHTEWHVDMIHAKKEWAEMNKPRVMKKYPTWREWFEQNADEEMPGYIAEELGVIPKEVVVDG